jgi:multiple sugar transport system substrate-binding protein/sn-glycerol 3-phosphate transport system substrate-binding protein
MTAIVAEFNATNEWGITVEALDQGRYSDVEDAMNVGIQSGDLPNLVVAYSNALANWWQVDVLADLDEYLYDPVYGLTEEEVADFFDAAYMGPVMDDGTRVGFPLSLSGNVMYCNDTWAKELGFGSAPTTAAEFKEQVCAASAANNADDNPDNDSTGGLVMYVGASNVASWIYAFGDDMMADDGSGYEFNTPEIQAVAAFLKDLWDEGCAFETESYPNPEFATRKALFTMSSTVGIPYQLSAFEAEEAFADDEWVFVPFIGAEGGEAVNAFSQSIGLVNITPEQNMAAWLFLKYMSNPETQATWILGSAYYPTRQSVPPMLTDYAAANPQWDTGLLLLKVGQAEPARSSWATVRREVQNTFSAILQSDPDQIVHLLEELDAIAAEAVAELDQ